MKKITTLLLLLLISSVYSQNVVDYSDRLSYFKGIAVFDGAKIDAANRFAKIETDIMVFSDKSAITFANCIVKVDGPIDATANCKIRLINSYIVCKKYKGPRSNRIIVTNNINDSRIGEISYLKKIKGNPSIEIIDKSGKIIARGSKSSLSNKIIKTGVYDVRSTGNFYDSNILLASD